ncbi:multidrug DMT transporter, partial [Escherichia coli]|nr:multidrug DMT transporter [Escherichia coli]
VYGYAISTQSMLFIIPLVAGIFLTLFSRRVSATNKHRDCSPQTNNGIHEHTETS